MRAPWWVPWFVLGSIAADVLLIYCIATWWGITPGVLAALAVLLTNARHYLARKYYTGPQFVPPDGLRHTVHVRVK